MASIGVSLIKAERERQFSREGYTDEHDDEHVYGQLSQASACYAHYAAQQMRGIYDARVPPSWPWSAESWKPEVNTVRNLEKAGALIAAELDRMGRAEISRQERLENGRDK